ncbi:MAG: tartrate-resistant acid phosphatase type 5 [Paraglaciecola sp.]|jgi:tartrate-resistant acid phosphatase type 5
MYLSRNTLLVCGLLWLCVSNAATAQQVYDEAFYQQHHIGKLKASPESINFLVLGDWGRNGHYQQRDVAKWMDVAMMQVDGDFIVTTGDNFYSNGVASVSDPYWQSSFEQIYQGPNLFENWYAILGNHDYRGNWQAQIDYSNVSRRWQMPAPYYAKTLELDDGASVLMIFLDTSPLNPEYQHEAKYAATQQQDSAKQLIWLKHKLAISNATWKIVIGHHPLYSSGKRYGKTSGIRNVLEPILENAKVDVYFAGHEHDLQHNQPVGKYMAHFVSGAGSEVRPVAQREFTKFAVSKAGFAAVSVNDKQLDVNFIDTSGQVLYHYQITKENK